MTTLLLADFKGAMTYVLYVLVAVLVLLVMITVHELGHYIVGKIFKFKINEFSIGFGPAIFKRQREDGEVFAIRLIPLGGYCAFEGEEDDAVKEGDFNSKKPWQRILVLIAGATMNFLTAILVVCIFFGAYGCPVYKVVDSEPNSDGKYVAMQGPLEDGDIILSIDGKNMYMITDYMSAIEDKSAGDTIKVVVMRDGEKKTLEFELYSHKLVVDGDGNQEYLPIGDIENIESISPTVAKLGVGSMQGVSVRFGFFEMLGRSFEYTFKLGGTIFKVLGQLITGALGLNAMGGTVSTISMTATGVQTYGMSFLLQITALIGVNLAVVNLLPIPSLDGSKVVFTVIEWLRGKPINRKVENIIHAVGLVLLLAFAVLVDIQHCF